MVVGADQKALETRILTERAVGIERAVHKLMAFSTGNDYRGSESGWQPILGFLYL